MVALKVTRKLPLKLSNNCNPIYRRPDTVKYEQKMCFQDSPAIMQKFIAIISLPTGIIDIDSMKRISSQVLTFVAIHTYTYIHNTYNIIYIARGGRERNIDGKNGIKDKRS